MANPNPFRQVPPEDDIRPEGSHSFFGDPKFEVTRSKVDFKEPLITSLPRTFSRLTRRQMTTAGKTELRRRQTVASNRKAISILVTLLVVLGGIWGSLEFGKTERRGRRMARHEKKLNLTRKSEDDKNAREGARPIATKGTPRLDIAKKVSSAKVALKALAMPVPENVEQPETDRPQKQDAPAPKTLFVTSPLLRVRSKPGLDGSVVRVLTAGDTVEVVGEEGSWAKLGEGEYVGKRHLAATKSMTLAAAAKSSDEAQPAKTPAKPEKPLGTKVETAAVKAAAPPPSSPAPATKHVALQSVKIRSAPGPKRQMVGVLRKGTVVSVYEIRGVWARIGDNQFVHKGNLRLETTPP